MNLSIGDIQVFYCLLNRHFFTPLPSRSVDKLAYAGFLTMDAPLTLPEGRSALAYYPSSLRITKEGARAYMKWILETYSNRAIPEVRARDLEQLRSIE